MDTYEIWVNLRPEIRDLDFVQSVQNYLGFLQKQGKIESFRIRRRKLGWGPESLGEFNISIETLNMAQLDEAFKTVASRSSEVESLHAKVFSSVTDFRSALYRDFPAEERP
jgi:hypothetical protein